MKKKNNVNEYAPHSCYMFVQFEWFVVGVWEFPRNYQKKKKNIGCCSLKSWSRRFPFSQQQQPTNRSKKKILYYIILWSSDSKIYSKAAKFKISHIEFGLKWTSNPRGYFFSNNFFLFRFILLVVWQGGTEITKKNWKKKIFLVREQRAFRDNKNHFFFSVCLIFWMLNCEFWKSLEAFCGNFFQIFTESKSILWSPGKQRVYFYNKIHPFMFATYRKKSASTSV